VPHCVCERRAMLIVTQITCHVNLNHGGRKSVMKEWTYLRSVTRLAKISDCGIEQEFWQTSGLTSEARAI